MTKNNTRRVATQIHNIQKTPSSTLPDFLIWLYCMLSDLMRAIADDIFIAIFAR
jgi:hypothetical protein